MKKNLPQRFTLGTVTTTDKNLIVNMFNKYFVDLGPNLAKHLHRPASMMINNKTQLLTHSSTDILHKKIHGFIFNFSQ